MTMLIIAGRVGVDAAAPRRVCTADQGAGQDGKITEALEYGKRP
jgi:hypothetical protein